VSQKRSDKLEGIGFVWSIPDEQFQKRLEELRKFVEANGFGENPPVKTHKKLYEWLYNQQLYYEREKLKKERVLALQKLGFLLYK
jgi:hypothetical protein